MSRRRLLLSAVAALAALGVLYPVAAHAQTATVSVPSVKASKGGEAKVPIKVSEPSDMGALHVELTYDESVLKATKVEKGGVAANALVDFNVQPGRVVIGIVSSDPITSDGDAAVVTFDVLGDKGAKSALGLENVRAWQADVNRFDIKLVPQPGELTVGSKSSFPWWIIVVAAALVIAFIVWRRRSGGTPAPAPPPVPVGAGVGATPPASATAEAWIYVDASEPILASDGSQIGTLEPGSWHELRRQVGDSIEVTSADGTTGWVRASSVRRA